ncbi:MAG: outer membrane lipoprotein carrier protein LolA [Alistipes sp.]
MKRSVACVCAMLCCVLSAFADEQALRILNAMEQTLSAMGTYRVEFEIVAGDYRTEGEYVVAGDDFYVRADDTEVYAEAGIRREISRSKREITVDDIDTSARDIISNPSSGFASLSADFDSAASTDADGVLRIVFSPKDASVSGESVTVEMANGGKLPKTIIYKTSAGEVVVRMTDIAPAKAGLPRFDAKRYEGYEVVDFR